VLVVWPSLKAAVTSRYLLEDIVNLGGATRPFVLKSRQISTENSAADDRRDGEAWNNSLASKQGWGKSWGWTTSDSWPTPSKNLLLEGKVGGKKKGGGYL
jgi:hypothetical protein